ncbi:MAG: phosphoribosylglycinamide formyltransferase [Ignavibacteria bacterium]|nr:phosphoribosylglycinamide formyltransferase [Ignavibacteria bacterium]
MNICIFASGTGTNFNSILKAKKRGKIKSEIPLLITNNSKCKAAEIAKRNNVNVEHISRKVYPDHSDRAYSNLFLSALKKNDIDLIVLAGYMKLIEVPVVRRYKNRIINIHPALLPSFGGQGMYGMNVHRAVIEAGVKVSGVSIHFVNEKYDEGKIIYQKCVPVSDDDEFSLQKKVLKLEHKSYVEVIKMMEEGKIKIG